MKQVTNKMIRDYLGHNGNDCKVKISNKGIVSRYGDTNPFNRNGDSWRFIGFIEDIKQDLLRSV